MALLRDSLSRFSQRLFAGLYSLEGKERREEEGEQQQEEEDEKKNEKEKKRGSWFPSQSTKQIADI